MSGVGAQARFVHVQHARIIEAPLNDVDGVNDGGFSRGFAGLHDALFARLQVDSAASVIQCHQTVEQRQHSAPVISHREVEFGAANGAGGQRRAELDRGRFLAAEKVSRARAQIEHRCVAFFWRRLDSQRGQLVDAQNAFVGESESCSAAQAGPQTVADLEDLIGAGRRPRRGAGGEDLDFTFDGQQDRLGFVPTLWGKGLGAQAASEQEREKRRPRSLEHTGHQSIGYVKRRV